MIRALCDGNSIRGTSRIVDADKNTIMWLSRRRRRRPEGSDLAADARAGYTCWVTQDFWKKYWKGVYAMPRAWAVKGENLFHAFEVLADAAKSGTDVGAQALMLAGMSIEVMLKTLLVHDPGVRAVVTKHKQKECTNTADKVLWKTFYSHDLVKLAAAAGVSLSANEELVAGALTHHINWCGRYVVPVASGLDAFNPAVLSATTRGPAFAVATPNAARDLARHVIREVKARVYGEKT